MPGSPSTLTPGEELERALLALDRVSASRVFRDADPQRAPIERVEHLIVPVLERIGAGWEAGTVSLAQVYMSGRLCEELVDTLLPANDSARIAHPPMAIAVLEDYHFLGLRLVFSALRASGYALINYGHCDVDQLVERVCQDGIRILLISTLMLPSALRVRDVRHRLQTAKHAVTLIVGGAPYRFDDQLWHEVGADAVGASAGEAAGLIRQYLGDR